MLNTDARFGRAGIWLLTTIAVFFLAPSCWAQDLELYEAIRRGRVEVVADYLADGGDPNAVTTVPNGQSWPLLKIALYDREEEIALTLLARGAEFALSGAIVHTVAGEGMARVLDYLLVQDPTRLTSQPMDVGLAKASLRGYFDVVEVFLAHGRRLSVDWGDVLTEAVHISLSLGHDDIARLLLQEARPHGTVLHVAARDSSPGIVRFMLELGADPLARKSVDIGDRTPIEFAWTQYESGDRGEDRELVIFELLQVGAQLNVPNVANIAVDGLRQLSTSELLNDPSARVTLAATLGYYDVVAELIRSPSPLSREDLRPALIAAIARDHDDIARLLIDAGAPVSGGVLHAAVQWSSPGIVRTLISRGASTSEKVAEQTALDRWVEGNLSNQGPNVAYVLFELIRGGADACWLRERRSQLSNLSWAILQDTATQCWPVD